MNILLLAPHPFYQERGTPIAVNLLLNALSTQGHTVDVLTYHEGMDVTHPGVTIHRIKPPPFAKGVPPGPSLKKIFCDLAMAPHALRMAREGRYDVVHAVEESVYMAMAIKRRTGIPYLYDMDSSLARQIAEKFPFLKWLLPPMTRSERAAIRGALAAVPVCDALADIAHADGARKVVLLRDISLLKPSTPDDTEAIGKLVPQDPRPCFMYVGNLETYQGADLMLDSFALFITNGGKARLVIAGGKPADIQQYQAKASALGVSQDILFLGPQPVSRMAALFERADVLLSPRIKGNNTPMKIYSYLASGKAVLATALPTHTQVLTPEVALLAPPEVKAFAEAMGKLASDRNLRERLGNTARTLADRNYSQEAFQKTARELYQWVEQELGQKSSRTTLLIDGHVHIYPGYDWQKAVTNLLGNLPGSGAKDAPLMIGLLAESKANRFYRDVLETPSRFVGGPIELSPGPDAGSIAIRSQGVVRGYLIAGRQIVTCEKLEILALGVDVSVPDGLTADETLSAIRSAGAVPVLSWSPGKWFGQRGKTIKALITHSTPDRFLIGDTGMRPTLWPLPCLMRLALKKGFTIIAGSDPMPLPGEERWVGTYGITTTAGFDSEKPATSIRRLLSCPEPRFTLTGKRSPTLSFLSRWIRNQLSR